MHQQPQQSQSPSVCREDPCWVGVGVGATARHDEETETVGQQVDDTVTNQPLRTPPPHPLARTSNIERADHPNIDGFTAIRGKPPIIFSRAQTISGDGGLHQKG